MKLSVLILAGMMLIASSVFGAAGDVNNDGNYDLKDVIATLQVCAGLTPAGVSTAGDADNNGKIGLQEAIYVLQIVAGLREPTKQILFAAEGGSPVNINFTLIEPSSSSNAVNTVLPDGKTAVLTQNQIAANEANSYTWYGKIENDITSTAVLSVVGGVMFGHIDTKGESYFIQPEGSGYKVVKNNPALIPKNGNDTIVPDINLLNRRFNRQSTRNSEDGTVIDVMVLYTAQMQTRYGTGIRALIQNYVDLTNRAYTNSGINTQLRLVYTGLYDNPASGEGNIINSALDHITASAQIAAMRNQYYADLVSLLRVYPGNGSYCGLAYMMSSDVLAPQFENHAFSVVEVRPMSEANPYYCAEDTFAHELGHNFGCAHDRSHAGSSGAYPYSYGYDKANVFATIMSYNYPKITYFSTPYVTYNGYPIGKDENQPDAAYNAKTINNTRILVANFRNPPSPVSPPTNVKANGTIGYIAISWDSVNGASCYIVYRNTSNSLTGALPISSWQTLTHYEDYSATTGRIYYYWIKATANCTGANSSDFSKSVSGAKEIPKNPPEIPSL